MIHFSIINKTLIPVKRSDCTLSFLRLLAMLIHMHKENKKGRLYVFQDTYVKSSQIHQLTIMYRFEHT